MIRGEYKLINISAEERKEIQLQLLMEVSSICECNKLRYFLAYGTLLGAVRHKGFIPWDDDIDIVMPRKDYLQFIRIFEVKKHDWISIVSPEIDSNASFTFTKIYDNRTIKYEEGMDYSECNPYGIDIDIFPIDGTPSSLFMRKIFILKQLFMFRLYVASISKYRKDKNAIKSIIKKLFYFVSHKIGKHHLIKLMNKNASQYDFDTSDIVAMSIAPYCGKIYLTNRNVFDSTYLIFENKKYTVPKGYDIFLRTVYGNYMELPPLEHQVTHHLYKAYWK